jgi:rsbT co-antagonist protein RsbR
MANISPGSAGRATYMTVATAAVAPTGRLVGSDEEEGHSDMPGPQQDMAPDEKSGDDGELLSALVAHLRDNRSPLRQQWVDRITDAHLLSAMTAREVFTEVTSVYDNYVAVIETGSVEELQHYARDLSERIIPRGVETHEVVGIVLLLRDVLARSLFEKYRHDFDLLHQVLDTYEPAANRVANTVAVSFVEERERVIGQQQDAIRELSTPVLQVRERLLILPIIGLLDAARAHQLTEQLLQGIRTHRATVVVLDITGVPDIDEAVADHLASTIDASRLMGAEIITTGLSPAIAQTLVAIGADIGKLNTAGDLQGGLEQAEHRLGLALIRTVG